MKAPPGKPRRQEARTPAANPEGGKPHPHRIPRKWRDDAIRVCLDLGYVVSGAQAWQLIKEYRAWQGTAPRRFVAREFRVYVQRRGDLLIVRGKAHHDWRVTS